MLLMLIYIVAYADPFRAGDPGKGTLAVLGYARAQPPLR
jgi:hypothetical protein